MAECEFEDLLLGRTGWRARDLWLVFGIGLAASVPATFLLFSHVFVAATPPHFCRIPYNTTGMSMTEAKAAFIPNWGEELGDTEKFAQCQIYQDNPDPNSTAGAGRVKIACPAGWDYDTRYLGTTLVTKLDLVCERKWMLLLSTTLFYFGSLAGNLIFGWASDRFGRKSVFFPMLLVEAILSLLTTFAPPDILVYTILRSIRGLFFPGIFQIPLILCVEIVNAKWRAIVVMLFCCMSAGAASLLALISYLTRDFQKLSLYLSIPSLALAVTYWWIPESPRWLLSKGRVEETYLVLHRTLGVRKESWLALRLLEVTEKGPDEAEGRTDSAYDEGIVDIIKKPVLIVRLLVLMCNYCGCNMAYNGLAYVSPQQLKMHPHLSFFINGIVEVPGYLLGWWSIDKIGRRSTLTICMIVGGLASTLTTLISTEIELSRLMLIMLVKMMCGCGFTVLYVYLGELMPTTIRSKATALVSFTSGSCLLILPYLLQMDSDDRETGEWTVSVMGWLWLFSGSVSWFFLPETLHLTLPQTISEAAERPRQARRTQDADGVRDFDNKNSNRTPLLFSFLSRLKNSEIRGGEDQGLEKQDEKHDRKDKR